MIPTQRRVRGGRAAGSRAPGRSAPARSRRGFLPAPAPLPDPRRRPRHGPHRMDRKGRNSVTLQGLLRPTRRPANQIRAISIDMTGEYQRATRDAFPHAEIAFGVPRRRLGADAVDQAPRRANAHERSHTVAGRWHTRWALLKAPDRQSPQQQLVPSVRSTSATVACTAPSCCTTSCVCSTRSRTRARPSAPRCLAGLGRAQPLEPFVKTARTLRCHRAVILAAIRLALSNGRLEGLNRTCAPVMESGVSAPGACNRPVMTHARLSLARAHFSGRPRAGLHLGKRTLSKDHDAAVSRPLFADHHRGALRRAAVAIALEIDEPRPLPAQPPAHRARAHPVIPVPVLGGPATVGGPSRRQSAARRAHRTSRGRSAGPSSPLASRRPALPSARRSSTTRLRRGVERFRESPEPLVRGDETKADRREWSPGLVGDDRPQLRPPPGASILSPRA